MSSTSLTGSGRLQAATTTDGLLDLGALFPPLAQYCPLTYTSPGLHENVPQCLFLLRDEEEVFYGGAVGGGKSAALLMAALQYVDQPGYRALILRRTFAQLSKGDALIPLSHEWLSNTDARWVGSPTPKWTFPSGATIEFGHMQDEKAMYDYQGAAWHFVGFDELTQFNYSTYEYVSLSRTRRVKAMQDAGIPNRVRSTGNPGGIGHGWVKQRFIDPDGRAPGVVFIPARMRDNPGLDHDDYSRRLGKLTENRRRQLEDGDWDVFEGQAYPELDDQVHGVPGLPLGLIEHWARWESMDYGVANETVWHLYTVDYDGNIVVADEYTAKDTVVRRLAAEVVSRRGEWWEQRDDDGRPVRHVCWGDPSIAARTGAAESKIGDPLSVKDVFREHGVAVSAANNRRPAGYAKVRDLLQQDPGRPFPAWHPLAGQHGAPRLYVAVDRCPGLWKNLGDAPIAAGENDPLRGIAVDGAWESSYGHWHASARYGLLSPDRQSRVPVEKPPADPREARMWERRQERLRDAKRHRGRRPAQDW